MHLPGTPLAPQARAGAGAAVRRSRAALLVAGPDQRVPHATRVGIRPRTRTPATSSCCRSPGTKRWSISDTNVKLPLRLQRFQPATRPGDTSDALQLCTGSALLHVLDDVHRRRPHERRQRPLRQRIPILDRPRRFAVRQPPLRGARQRQRLLALVVRVVELRDIDPLRRLARQERQRAARRRVYRARAVNNASSIPRLSRGLSSLRFSARISLSSSRADAFRPGFFCPSGSSQLLPSDAPRGAARRRPVRKMAALLSSRDGLWNLDRVWGN